MRVKVHPHKPLVDNGSEACVSITKMKKNARAYYMGTVMLSDVSFVVHESGFKRMQDEGHKNVHAWVTGEVIHESIEQNQPTHKVRGKMVKVDYDCDTGRFMADADDVTDKKFPAAYVVGADLYVAKEA